MVKFGLVVAAVVMVLAGSGAAQESGKIVGWGGQVAQS